MIFWFSGTGNSFSIAQNLAKGLGEAAIPLSRAAERKLEEVLDGLAPGERIGFVYPVYAWGPPRMVLDFVKALKLPQRMKAAPPFVFSVSTCGDEEGHATRLLQKALEQASLHLDSAFTIPMPNNYVIGFDVDEQAVVAKKNKDAAERAQEILAVLRERRKGVYSLIPGKAAAIKTVLVNPLFRRYAVDVTRFRVSDVCTGCGLCEDLCPSRNIVRHEGKPVWGNRCTQCLACLHQCPVRAIDYGRATMKKGRYVHPDAKGMRGAMRLDGMDQGDGR